MCDEGSKGRMKPNSATWGITAQEMLLQEPWILFEKMDNKTHQYSQETKRFILIIIKDAGSGTGGGKRFIDKWKLLKTTLLQLR